MLLIQNAHIPAAPRGHYPLYVVSMLLIQGRGGSQSQGRSLSTLRGEHAAYQEWDGQRTRRPSLSTLRGEHAAYQAAMQMKKQAKRHYPLYVVSMLLMAQVRVTPSWSRSLSTLRGEHAAYLRVVFRVPLDPSLSTLRGEHAAYGCIAIIFDRFQSLSTLRGEHAAYTPSDKYLSNGKW